MITAGWPLRGGRGTKKLQKYQKIIRKKRIYFIHRHNYDTPIYLEDHWETGLYVWGTKQMKIFIILHRVLLHDTRHFRSVCRKDMQCGESPTAGFLCQFCRRSFHRWHTAWRLHAVSVFRMEWPCGKFYAAMALRAVSTWPHYPTSPGMWLILSFITGKCTTGRALF